MRAKKYIEPDVNRCKEDKDKTDSSATNYKGKLGRVGMQENVPLHAHKIK